VRVRVVLGLATLVVAGGLVLDMSRSAPRTAGSDHVAPLIFSASLPGAGSICQPVLSLPREAAVAQLTVGTYGKRVPALTLRFLSASRAVTGEGQLRAGAHEGVVTMPLHARADAEAASEVCLYVQHPRGTTVVGGEGVPEGPTSERVNGHTAPGQISLRYLRRGSESWWDLMPALSERFGLGKASFFGSWLFALAALGLLGVWIVAVRLLARELGGASSG
jgi:hypothetical protein